MALLPSAGSENTVGVLITTVADDGAIKTTQAELSVLGDAAKASGAAASSAFDNFNSSLKSAGQQMTEAGKSMSTYVTAPIVGIGAAAFLAGSSFQQNMTYIRTQAGDTTDNIAQLSDQVLQLSKNSEFTPDQLAQGLYHLASVGMTGTTAISALNAAQELAAVGGSNLDDTTQALTVAWKSGITGAQDFQQAVGTMNAIVGAGDMHLQDLVGAMGPTGLLAAAKSAGLSLGDIGAALAQLSDMTGNAQESATHLRQALLLMQSPSKQAADYLNTIGFSATQLGVDLQEKGMMGTLEDLKTHLTNTFGSTALTSLNTYTQILGTDGPTAADAFANSSENAATVISKAFGGSKSSSVIMQLLTNLDQLNSKEQAIATGSSQFASDYAATQQTAAYQMHHAYAVIMADLTQLGDAIMPEVTHAMGDVTHAISSVTTWFEQLNPQNKQLVINLALTAAAAGPVLVVFGTMAKSLSSILTLADGVGGGLLKLGGMLGALGGGGEAAGLAGGLGAAGEASAGALASFGPVGIGIAALGLAAGGTYLLIKHFADENNQMAHDTTTNVTPAMALFSKTAQELGYTVTGTSSSVDMLTLAQIHQQDSSNILKSAQDKLKTSQDTYKTSQVDLTKTTNNYQKAQQDAQAALDKYGQNSPQYVTAAQKVTDAYYAQAQQLNNTARASLGLQIQGGILNSAWGVWSNNAFDFAAAQNAINAAFKGGVNVIAQFGPTAIDQVKSIDTLQAHLSTVVTSWNGLVANFGNQNLILNSSLQGLQSKVTTLQNTASTFDLHMTSAANAASKVQNSGVSLQAGNYGGLQPHAAGTNYAPGGWSMVGENGPEAMYVPQGAMIKTSGQTSGMHSSNGRGDVTIYQTVNNYSNADMTEANRNLAFQLSGV